MTFLFKNELKKKWKNYSARIKEFDLISNALSSWLEAKSELDKMLICKDLLFCVLCQNSKVMRVCSILQISIGNVGGREIDIENGIGSLSSNYG